MCSSMWILSIARPSDTRAPNQSKSRNALRVISAGSGHTTRNGGEAGAENRRLTDWLGGTTHTDCAAAALFSSCAWRTRSDKESRRRSAHPPAGASAAATAPTLDAAHSPTTPRTIAILRAGCSGFFVDFGVQATTLKTLSSPHSASIPLIFLLRCWRHGKKYARNAAQECFDAHALWDRI